MRNNTLLITFVFLVFLAIFISACERKVECRPDVKICPGGASVGRVPPACDFAECPAVVCTQDARECPDGSYVSRVPPYCNFADCPPENSYLFIGDDKISLLCNSDEDCTLIRKKYGYACCYTGYCDVVDYYSKEYVPVNKEDFNRLRDLRCPNQEQCGPVPGCTVRIVNEYIKAKCVGGVCTKPYGEPESS